MPTIVRGQPTSAEVRQRLKDEGRPVLVSYSGGKDAIAANIALRDAGVETCLVYMYSIPGREHGKTLGFIEEGLAAQEAVFGQKIHRYPHPALWRMLNSLVYQPPERIYTIEAAQMPLYTFEETWEVIRTDLNYPADTWVADGVRAADSIVRRASMVRHGVMKEHLRKVSPIHDWLKAEVFAAIESAGVPLPPDYAAHMFGRSFDGIDYRFLKPLESAYPDDFARILDWFPLARAELIRREHYDWSHRAGQVFPPGSPHDSTAKEDQ